MLLGNFNPYTEKLEIPKSYQVFSNFKKRVLNPAYKELKKKGLLFWYDSQTEKVSLLFHFPNWEGKIESFLKRLYLFSWFSFTWVGAWKNLSPFTGTFDSGAL